MHILFLLFFVFALASCSDQKDGSILNTDALPKQSFRVNTARDTVLTTAGGALIKIGKESLSGSVEAELEIKEAYSFEDIVKAGLTTQSNGRPLRSGGMIYINAADKNVKVAKTIDISLPTKAYDAGMKLFKGEEKDGEITWVEPKVLSDTLSPHLMKGKALFNAICATCHAFEKIKTGPALAGLEGRGPWKNRDELLKFTVNPGAYIAHNCYAYNLASQYNGQIMPSFPMFYESDTFPRMKADLNSIYDYLRAEDVKRGIEPSNASANDLCEDSCLRYDSVRYTVEEKLVLLAQSRQGLIDSNGKRINYQRWNDSGTSRLPEARDERGIVPKDLVEPEEYGAVYYRFDITSFGWYNIDDLLETAKGEMNNLQVSVANDLSEQWDVFIAVPKLKTFDRGGKLTDGVHYGFFTRDGKIPLRVGEKVIVFALSEVEGKIAFDFKEFVSVSDNDVRLSPKLISKDEFNTAVKQFSLERASILAGDSKNAAEIRKVDGEMKKQESLVEFYRPKNCHCDCGSQPRDSTTTVKK